MTWIVGLTGLRTCGVLAGDIRVTSADGRVTFDGVQKVHLITPSAAVGFAGSVRFGLRVVDDLRRHATSYLTPRAATDFRGAIQGWGRRVRRAWQTELDARSRTVPLQLIVMTSRHHPDARDAERELAAAEEQVQRSQPFRELRAELAERGVTFADTSAYVLRSPGFDVEPVRERSAVAIGSGRAYELLTGQLASIEQEIEGLLPFEIEPAFLAIGGPAAPVRVVLAEAISEVDPRDVSEHLHVASVKPNASTIVTFDTEGLTPGAPSRTMPAVATTEAEFEELARGYHVADAVASSEFAPVLVPT